MLAYAVLVLISGILAITTLAGEEKAGYLLAFWIMVLLIATLAFFVIVHGGHQRLRLTMPEGLSQKYVPASTPLPSPPLKGGGGRMQAQMGDGGVTSASP
jgi:hypothetical protein